MEGFECFHHQTAYRHDHEPFSLRYDQRPEGHGIAFLKAIQRIVSSNLLLVNFRRKNAISDMRPVTLGSESSVVIWLVSIPVSGLAPT
jgi:hypothetical protein